MTDFELLRCVSPEASCFCCTRVLFPAQLGREEKGGSLALGCFLSAAGCNGGGGGPAWIHGKGPVLLVSSGPEQAVAFDPPVSCLKP